MPKMKTRLALAKEAISHGIFAHENYSQYVHKREAEGRSAMKYLDYMDYKTAIAQQIYEEYKAMHGGTCLLQSMFRNGSREEFDMHWQDIKAWIASQNGIPPSIR